LPGSPLKEYSPAPGLGQHNVQILKGIGFSNKNIEDLKTQGAI
jgi:crotonobetainyl-CoA:carnitine CoA-transferase CaiB-like acyl-CoA transferase